MWQAGLRGKGGASLSSQMPLLLSDPSRDARRFRRLAALALVGRPWRPCPALLCCAAALSLCLPLACSPQAAAGRRCLTGPPEPIFSPPSPPPPLPCCLPTPTHGTPPPRQAQGPRDDLHVGRPQEGRGRGREGAGAGAGAARRLRRGGLGQQPLPRVALVAGRARRPSVMAHRTCPWWGREQGRGEARHGTSHTYGMDRGRGYIGHGTRVTAVVHAGLFGRRLPPSPPSTHPPPRPCTPSQGTNWFWHHMLFYGMVGAICID